MTTATIQAEAKALWERHAALLKAPVRTENRVACEALDVARLRGGEREGEGQMALDVRPR